MGEYSDFVDGARSLAGRAGAKTAAQVADDDRASIYQPIKLLVTTSDKPRLISVSGDTLHVAEINGPIPIYVRLGADSNPYVRIRAGMTLKRKFSEITIRPGDTSAGLVPNPVKNTDVLFYVSFGDFIIEPAKEYGFKKGALAWRDDATTTEQDLFRYANGGSTSSRATIGKIGGFFMVKNGSLMTRLFLRYGSNSPVDAVSSSIWPIDPGETLIVPLEQRGMTIPYNVSSPTSSDGITIQAESGTCPFYVMVGSNEVDDFDGYSVKKSVL